MTHMIRYSALLIALSLLLSPIAAKEQTTKALRLANQWQEKNGSAIKGPDGRILFVYGEAQPVIVCGVFLICDVAMERGEVIDTVTIGDNVRWVVSPARVGTGEQAIDHIVIKPTEADLRTNLFVATDRRAYMMELVSTQAESMGQVGFLYGNAPWTPQTVPPRIQSSLTQASLQGVKTHQSDMAILPRPAASAATALPSVIEVESAPLGRSVIAEALNFNYRIAGPRVPWRPIRVYDDGQQTYIDFDQQRIASSTLPVFLSNDTDRIGYMINYRYTNGRMIVDGLFNHGTLLLGKGRKADKVTIKRARIDRTAGQ